MAIKSISVCSLAPPPADRYKRQGVLWGAAIGRQPVSECIRTMESVIGEGIVSYESTLAIAATIVLGLLNQSRLAQRAVRYTQDPCHPGLAVSHRRSTTCAHRPGKRGERLG